MKISLLNSAMLAVTLALATVSPVEAGTAYAEEAPAAAADTVDADPALWVVKDEDTTIYLFGTVHILKPGLSWFDEGVRKAFDESDELVLEVLGTDDPQSQQLAIAAGTDEVKGPFRTTLMTDEQRQAYEAALASISIPPTAFDQFEPWLAGISLGVIPLVQKGYDPNSGAERVLTEQAKADKRQLGALETLPEQLAFFDELPEEHQVAFVNEVVGQIDQIETFIDRMVSLWSEAKVDELGDLLQADFTGDPLLYDTLIVKRNAAWTDWIENRLDQPGTIFIAVGAGHLAGSDSVQTMLAAKGITVERVNY